jgi:threonine-phosphate decarboxylase
MDFPLHGANADKLYSLFGIDKPQNMIDFSTNTNALGYSENPEIDYEQLSSTYPDDECLALREIIAKKEKCNIQNILITNGSNEGLYLISSYLSGKKVGIFQPAYTEYKRAVQAYDGEIINIFDIHHITNDLGAIFICNPSNPMGKYIEATIIEEKIMNNPKILFIIDEAYIDFLYETPKHIDFTRYENLYILRSFTKIFHLSGVRIGYVLSSKDNILKLKKRQPTWSVNAIALESAVKFFNNSDYINRTKNYYYHEMQRVLAKLKELGFEVMDSSVNFFLLKTNNDEVFIKYLLKHGIVVRHTRNYPSLDGQYVRISLGSAKENDFLINCLRRLTQ